MNQITTIARLPGTGGGQESKLPAEVGKQAVPDITKHPIWGRYSQASQAAADRLRFAPFEYEERN